MNPLSVIIVGTFAGGGINHYINNLTVEIEDEVNVITHDAVSYQSRTGLISGLTLGAESVAAILKFPFYETPDVVHVNCSHKISFYRSIPYIVLAKHYWHCPVLLHIHSSGFDKFINGAGKLREPILKRVFDESDRIIVLSDYWKQFFRKYTSENKIVPIRNAVTTTDYQPSYDNGGYITFIGQLNDRKGVLDLIDATVRLHEMDVDCVLRIAGSGKHREHVLAAADEYDYIEYYGYVPEETKIELLNTSDVFALPTKAEGMPISILEAMAGGNSIISTPVGSIPEVVTEDRGKLHEPGNIDELVEHLKYELENPKITAKRGRSNATEAKKYDWDRVSDTILELYGEVEGAEY